MKGERLVSEDGKVELLITRNDNLVWRRIISEKEKIENAAAASSSSVVVRKQTTLKSLALRKIRACFTQTLPRYSDSDSESEPSETETAFEPDDALVKNYSIWC